MLLHKMWTDNNKQMPSTSTHQWVHAGKNGILLVLFRDWFNSLVKGQQKMHIIYSPHNQLGANAPPSPTNVFKKNVNGLRGKNSWCANVVIERATNVDGTRLTDNNGTKLHYMADRLIGLARLSEVWQRAQTPRGMMPSTFFCKIIFCFLLRLAHFLHI